MLPRIDIYSIARSSAATVVQTTYGHEIVSNTDDYISLAADAIIGVASLGVVGLNPVDLLPFREWAFIGTRSS